MDHLLQDLRFAFRSLRSSPLLTVASLTSLALGIGASAAIFSAVDTFLFKPLEFEDSDRLVTIWSNNLDRGWTQMSTSPVDFQDWRREATSVALAAYTGAGVNMATDDGAIRLDGRAVTPGYFGLLGVSPQVGRAFRPEEEQAGGARVAILSNEVWQQTFGGDPSLLGRILQFDGEPTEIVGIMPEGFLFGNRQDVWVPLQFTGEELRGSRYVGILGRVSPDATIETTRTELGALASRLANSFPDSNAGVGVTMMRVQDDWFDEGFKQGSYISAAAVIFVLLIACANVANLLLARGADREREIALRAAIGAGRRRIIGQLLTESLVLALVGGVLGIGVGYLGMEGIRGMFPPQMPGVNRLALDGRVLLFTGGLTLLSGIIFGLAPALQTSATDLRSALTDGGRGGSGRKGGRIRRALVMGEIGLSVVLLISAVLLVKAFTQLRTAELGYDLQEVATMRLTLPEQKYPTPESLRAFQSDLTERVAALPGVDAAALASHRPMWGNSASTYAVVGEPPPEEGREPAVNIRYVSADYWDAMGISRVAGRVFGVRDQAETPLVVVINERFAARHWDGRSPLGQRITIWGEDREIVGVVADTRDWGPDSDPATLLYAPMTQRTSRSPWLMVRTDQEISAIAAAVRDEVRTMDADQAVYEFATLEQVLEDEVAGNMAMAKVLGALALIAFLLSAVGIYGVMAYSVAQRTQEIGIRQSLGADRGDVRRLVVRQGLGLAAVGTIGGIAVALSTTRLLAFFLFGVSPFDPVAFVGVPAAVLLTGLLATWIPAVRATRVDPVVALKGD